MNKTLLLLFSALCLISAEMSHSQTTLSGDHIVTGDLNVGTTGTTGNLQVTADTGNSAPPSLKVSGDGGVVFTGSSGVGTLPVTGAGNRFMWYPKKAAIRAGEVTSNIWDDAQVGSSSAAFGYQVWAGGPASFVTGGYSRALDTYAAAFNGGTTASGQASAAFNYFTTASWIAAFATGYDTTASGRSSASFGEITEAAGDYAASFGYATIALGDDSLATGRSSVASGESSFASGKETYAVGNHSLAAGFNTMAESYAAVAIGRWNVGGGTDDSWVATDPVFEIGIGANDEDKLNALTVYKNGKIKMERQGDILMGEFGNPE